MASPTVRGRTTPAAGLSITSPVGTAVGDLVICFTFERAGSGVPTHTVQSASGFNEIATINHNDGSTDGRLSAAWKRATVAGANSYQAYTSSVGTETWSGAVVLTTATWDVASITAATASQTGTGLFDPPSVTLGNTKDWLVLAVAGYHHGSSATITPTAPTNYANLIEVAGASTGDLAIADRSLSAPASEDPGTFGDNVTPNGTCGMTIGIPGVVERTFVVQLPISPTIDSVMGKTVSGVSPSAAPATAAPATPDGLDVTIGPSAAAAAAAGDSTLDVDTGGVTEQTFVVQLPVGLTVDTALSRTAFASVTTPLDPSIATALSREAFFSVTDPLDPSIATALTRTQFLSADRDLAPTVDTALSRTAFASVTDPLELDISVRLRLPEVGNPHAKDAAVLGVG